MSCLIVATFGNQFEAAAAFEKLMSRGLQRQQGSMRCDESVGGSAASASSPTTVVSDTSQPGKHAGKRPARERRVLRAPASIPPAADLGVAVLTIQIDDDAQIEDVMSVMCTEQARDVHILPGETLPAQTAGLWPEQEMGPRSDVDRAIAASPLGKPRLH